MVSCSSDCQIALMSPVSLSSTDMYTFSAICLDVIQPEDTIRELRCQHVFHQACLDTWFNRRHDDCPLCKALYFDEIPDYGATISGASAAFGSAI